MAGSMLFLSKTIGTKVPTSAETTITQSMDSAMVKLIVVSSPRNYPNTTSNPPSAIPLIRLSPTSLSNRLNKLPLTISFAKP